MKNILNRSQTSVYIIPIFIIVFIVDRFTNGNLYELFSIYPKKAFIPTYWYTFLTYSFIHGGFGHLIGNSLRLLFVSLIIEPRIPKFQFRLLVLLSILLGGICYCLFSSFNVPMIGSGTILSALGGALIGTWIKSKKDFNSLENIYTLLGICLSSISLVIALVYLVLGKFEGTPIIYVKLLLFIFGFCFILFLSRHYKIKLQERYNKVTALNSDTAVAESE